jgi:hypothetical protein
VKEQLAVHKEEGEIMESPGDEEESGGVPESISHNCWID